MPDAEIATLTIERIGAQGDGVARCHDVLVFVPFTAPGDVVRVALGPRRGEGRAATLREVISPGARATPVCAHFGECGGCALQHLDAAAYAAAKEAWLVAALARHGLAPDRVLPLHQLPSRTRRRVRLQLEATRVGFHARASHRVIDVQGCAVLHPSLLALLSPLRRLAKTLLRSRAAGTASATVTQNGIDLVLDLPEAPDLPQLESLAAFASAQDLARLSWRCGDAPNPVAQRRAVQVTMSGVTVDLPVDGFLQPSLDAEVALVTAVEEMIGSPRRIADLYAGIGTFTFALARRASVHAVEGAAEAVAALNRAAARSGIANVVSSERRNLATRPLDAEECGEFDAVLFDPPYAGAPAQSRALATSRVPRVIAVSCNPATFARDARVLVDGGYRFVDVRPFDAFIWSANLELVARFERA